MIGERASLKCFTKVSNGGVACECEPKTFSTGLFLLSNYVKVFTLFEEMGCCTLGSSSSFSQKVCHDYFIQLSLAQCSPSICFVVVFLRTLDLQEDNCCEVKSLAFRFHLRIFTPTHMWCAIHKLWPRLYIIICVNSWMIPTHWHS